MTEGQEAYSVARWLQPPHAIGEKNRDLADKGLLPTQPFSSNDQCEHVNHVTLLAVAAEESFIRMSARSFPILQTL